MLTFNFYTNCTNSNRVGSYGECITEMVQSNLNKDLSISTLLKKHPEFLGELKDITGHSTKKGILEDWALSAASSFFQGKPCIYFRFSGIEYIYLNADDIESLKVGDELTARIAQIEALEEALDENPEWVNAKTPSEQKAALVAFCKSNESTFVEWQIMLSSLFAYATPFAKMVSQIDLTWNQEGIHALN